MAKEKNPILLIFIILIITSCTSNTETKNQKKELVIKDGLIMIELPNNLLLGNEPQKMDELCRNEKSEEIPAGAVSIHDQMKDCYVNKNGLVEQVYFKNQLKYRKELMYESALMEADFYKDLALEKVEFDNKNLTSAKVYVKKSEYEGGLKDSLNQKSRMLIKVYVTTYMGLYQIYDGVKPDKWKVHLNIYDVDTKELLYEYDYPTEEFPHIVI